jgi:hypothetical protein
VILPIGLWLVISIRLRSAIAFSSRTYVLCPDMAQRRGARKPSVNGASGSPG